MCLLKDVRGLGFCDLECFRALLVKQGWRILSNPQSLLARLLKGKYFSSTTFLNAKQGSRASWVSRVFYREEFCLRKVSIANWEMVNQFYVTKIVGFQLFFLISLELKRLMIIHLLWSLIWSIYLKGLEGIYLQSNFHEEGIAHIMSIPTRLINCEDKYVWHYNHQGCYSVKSKYRIACQLNAACFPSIAGDPGPSSSSNLTVFWRNFWKLELSHKLYFFLWHLFKGRLPTNENIH